MGFRYYHGNEKANEERVRRYLASHYEQEDASISRAFDHPAARKELDAGIRWGSAAGYVGDKIAAVMGWAECLAALDDCDKEPEERARA